MLNFNLHIDLGSEILLLNNMDFYLFLFCESTQYNITHLSNNLILGIMKNLIIVAVLMVLMNGQTNAQEKLSEGSISKYFEAFQSRSNDRKIQSINYNHENPASLDSIVVYRYSSEFDSTGAIKNEYQFDGAGNITSLIQSFWLTDQNRWRLGLKTIHEFDEGGMEIVVNQFQYNWNKEVWGARWRIEKSYDEDGNKILNLDFSWDEDTDDYKLTRKVEYTYDAMGNQTLSLNYDWEEDLNIWVQDWKEERAYDENGNRIHYLFCLLVS